MKVVTEIKFSSFLKTIYKAKNSNITRQEDFVKQIFESCNPTFSYSDDYCKRILNGNKPLSDDIRKFISGAGDYKDLPNFLKNNIDENRLSELIKDFDVNTDEKKDLGVFSEALSIQFDNYIKYGENNLPTTVKSIYAILLDQYGNGAIKDANEKALVAAKLYLFQAIKSLALIEVNEDILTQKAPFENFFNNVYKSFRAYESNCNLEGKKIYQHFKETILSGEMYIDDYLKKMAEPGALPIDLVKELTYTIYDNYKFDDRKIEHVIRLFDNDEKCKILEKFKKLKFYPVNEIFFTQRIAFHVEGNDKNLMHEALNICSKTQHIFDSIGVNLKQEYPNLVSIDSQLKKANEQLSSTNIHFVVDGTYFPETGLIEYASSIVPLLRIKGELTETGSQKFNFSKHIALRGIPKFTSFESKFKILFDSFHNFWKKSGYEETMAELVTFNRDNTSRWYMVPVTCKARLYRLVRDVLKLVQEDHIIGFIFTSIVSVNMIEIDKTNEEFSKKTSADRIKSGKDELLSYAFYNNKEFNRVITKEDSISGKGPTDAKISLPMFKPLIYNILIFNNDRNS
jgi:hypothetical protein